MSIKNYFTTLGLISLLVGCGDDVQKTMTKDKASSQPTTEQTTNVTEVSKDRFVADEYDNWCFVISHSVHHEFDGMNCTK